MPAAQALQAVNKAYVDQSIAELQQSLLSASGGNLSGPLYLSGDPTQPLQAADKHYVDTQVATALPLSGGAMTGALTLSADPTQSMQAADKEYVDASAANAWPAMVLRADEFAGADFGAKLQACVNAVSASYGGTCDARNFTGNQTMSASVTISTANTTVLLPCATISTANQIVVTAGTRNGSLRGCALRGGSAASGSQGGTALAYSGAGALIQVGDPTYATDTPGFHLDNVVINTTAATSAAAQGLMAYRTQEMDIESVYFLGNANQTGMTLDGTGNYTGGTFLDDQFDGFQTASERHWAPGCKCGDDGLAERELVCATAHRLPHVERESHCGDVRNQSAAGRWQHLHRRRCGGMRDGAAPGTECAEQHDGGVAQRELNQPGSGGCGQLVQRLDHGRHACSPGS